MRISDDSPDLARLADSNSPAFLFDARGALVWANAAAAVYWGTPRRAGLIATDFTRHAVAEQARALVRTLPEGSGRLERLRLVPFGRTTPLLAQVKRLPGPEGEGVLLVTALERVAEGRVAALRAAERAAVPAEPVQPAAPQPAPATQTAEEASPSPADAAPDEQIAVAAAASGEPIPPAEASVAEAPEALVAAPEQPEAASEASAHAEREAPAAGDAPGETAAAEISEPGAPDDPPASEAPAPTAVTAEAEAPPAAAAEPADEAPSPRAAAIAGRGRPLRFAWQTDAAGRLSRISPEFIEAVGAMPGDDEPLAAFAERAGLDDGTLATRLAAGASFAATVVAWPLADAPERAAVELAAVPAAGGYRGFGILRGLAPAAAPVEPAAEPIAADQTEPEAAPAPTAEPEAEPEPACAEEPTTSEAREPEAEVEPAAAEAPESPDAGEAAPQSAAAGAAPLVEPVGLAAAANANVLRFPGSPTPPVERRLAPSDEAALRTIARVLGGPIAVAANEQAPETAEPMPAPEPEPPPAREPERPSEAAAAEAEAQAAAMPSALFAGAAAEASELAELRQALAEARSRESELRGILDTASDGVVVIDGAGCIESLNRSAEALFGVESAEIAGQPFLHLIAPESQRVAADYLDGLAQHGVASLLNDGREVVGLERNGGTIPLFMTMGRLASSISGERTCAVLRDITQWKSAERELTEAKRQAERASHQKSDFLAKISHEIRTPLNAIIGFSEVMLEERFGRIENERYRGYLADIRASGEHLLSLVNDLLDLSKIESGRIDLIFGQVKLADIAQQAVATMQPQANREGVILRTSLPPVPPVVADARSIRQILFNLLSNAVKFTRSGGQVIVSLAATDAGEIALRVRDTGIGMSPAEVSMAMEPFRQVATRARFDGEGTGLGLPLTKALAEANRAAFSIDSHPGEGTLVQILFPTTRVLAE